MSLAMLQAIDAAATDSGLTTPAWVRQVVAERLNIFEPADLQPVRRYGGKSPDAAALTALRLQLQQLGGLLTQVAKVSRLDGEAARHADAERTLAEIRDTIAIVSKWQRERSDG